MVTDQTGRHQRTGTRQQVADIVDYQGQLYQVYVAGPTVVTSNSATEIIAAQSGFKIVIVNSAVNTDTALNLKIQDDAGTPIVIINEYLPANGGWRPLSGYLHHREGTSGQAMDALSSVDSVNVPVTLWYILVPA